MSVLLEQTKETITTINLIGAHPPTMGGVSVHVGRLASQLAKRGYDVEVNDPYTSRPSADGSNSYRLRRIRSFHQRVSLIWRLLFKPAKIVHLHLSHVGNLEAIVLVVAASFRSRRVVTIHSGSFPNQLAKHSKVEARLFRWMLDQCIGTICVSLRLKDALLKEHPHLWDRVHVIKPYLPPPEVDPLPRPQNGEKRLMAAGYGTSTYGWLTLLGALEGQLEELEINLVFYNTYNLDYFSCVMERLDLIGGNIRVHRDLNQAQFASLLASCDVFVRPTLTDGDSIAVREAIALGIPVVASDACERPEECILFRSEDSQSLQERIREALQIGPGGKRAQEEFTNCYEKVYNGKSG